jgi:signal transduction histidine kinase
VTDKNDAGAGLHRGRRGDPRAARADDLDRGSRTPIFAEERETNRIKDEFLSTLSHELRTPAQRDPRMDAAAARHAARTARSGHAMEVIERNARAGRSWWKILLDVSRGDDGQAAAGDAAAELLVGRHRRRPTPSAPPPRRSSSRLECAVRDGAGPDQRRRRPLAAGRLEPA